MQGKLSEPEVASRVTATRAGYLLTCSAAPITQKHTEQSQQLASMEHVRAHAGMLARRCADQGGTPMERLVGVRRGLED